MVLSVHRMGPRTTEYAKIIRIASNGSIFLIFVVNLEFIIQLLQNEAIATLIEYSLLFRHGFLSRRSGYHPLA